MTIIENKINDIIGFYEDLREGIIDTKNMDSPEFERVEKILENLRNARSYIVMGVQ